VGVFWLTALIEVLADSQHQMLDTEMNEYWMTQAFR
jgi:hypothetical protein